MSGDKLPWSKWFWRDWLGDLDLRMCSLAARGLWADMLAIMGQAEPYGHLVRNGEPIGPETLAAMVGAPMEQVAEALAELERRKVFSRTRSEIIYSRRMAREQKLRAANRTGGENRARASVRDDKGKFQHLDKPSQLHHQDGAQVAPRSTSSPRGQRKEEREEKGQTAPPSSPAARGGDAEWMELRKGIATSYEQARLLPPDTHWVEIWREKGYRPDVCLIAIRTDLARMVEQGDPPRSLKFYDRSVERAHQAVQRPSGEPAVAAGALNGGGAPIQWEGLMRLWVATAEQAWPPSAGPRPGFGGCKVPRELLTKYLPKQYPPLAPQP